MRPRGNASQRLWAGVSLLSLLGVWLVSYVAAQEPVADHPSDTLMLRELEDLYEPVPFSHKAHADMAGMWHGCETCHHRNPDNGATAVGVPMADGHTNHTKDQAAKIPACKSCHPADPRDAEIHMPSLKGAYHRQCLNCHKSWTGANQCVVCHKPKHGGEQLPGGEPTPDDIVGRMHPPLTAPDVKVYEVRYAPAAGRYVTFRHDEHVKTFGFKCVECHRRDTCDTCHDSQKPSGRNKPLNPAASWRESHGPCMACHDHQGCNHCHHEQGVDPPKFEHRMTGQLLDEDHAELACRECHGDVSFTAAPTCDNEGCHGVDMAIDFPQDRPGQRIAVLLPQVLRKPATDGMVHRGADLAARTTASETIITASPIVQRAAPAIATIKRPTTPSKSCVTEECHLAVKNFDVVHGPLAVDDCGVCHELVDEEKHLFTVVRQGAELCTYCHEFDVSEMPTVHAPSERGECLACHNPHGGFDHSLTRDRSTQDLCNRCHESVTEHLAFQHTPVAEGQCTACHAPHASRHANLLDAVGPELCLTCHDDFAKQLNEVTFAHKAMDEGCEKCHDVHGSAFPLALRAPTTTLCLECHEETRQRIETARVTHSPVSEERACMTCHTPHGGNVASLMRDQSARVCSSCHDKDIDTQDGRTIAAVPDAMNPDKFKHGSISEGQCRGCHTPHGGDHRNLLAANYTTAFYQPFDAESFELCFTCHDQNLAAQRVLEEPQLQATGFRNGDLNLHYLHVNKQLGRTCRVCHETHTGDNDRLIRDVVRYRQWEAPLEFTRTETGGRCTSGCHVPFSYDRQHPVELAAQREAGKAAQYVRAAAGDPIEMLWHGSDITGKPLNIPDENHATLLLIIRGDGQAAVKAIASLRDLSPQAHDVQVVLVMVGDPDEQSLDAVKQAAGDDWRLVVQAGDPLPGVDAHASPLALIVQRDGRILTRVGGATRSLGLTLRAYLQLLDQGDQVDDKPAVIANRVVVAGVEPAQYLRLARQLIHDGQPDRAIHVLREAIALHHANGALQVLLAQALIDAGREADAVDLLDRLPEDAASPETRSLLRARAAMASDDWDAAAKIVTAVLADHPESGEAHFLMGRIHQHAGNWREAAESFMKAHTAE